MSVTTPASAAIQWLMTTPAALAVTTPDGVVESATPRFAAALGASTESLTGVRLADVVAPDDRPGFASLLGRVAAFDTTTGEPSPEGSVVASGWADGAMPFRARFEVSPIPGGGAAVLGVERRNPEIVAAGAGVGAGTGVLETAPSFTAEIAGALSHDVRASLRSVNGFLGLVGRSASVQNDEAAAKHLRTSREAGAAADVGVEAIVRLIRVRERPLVVRDVPLQGILDKGIQHSLEVLPGAMPAIAVPPGNLTVLCDPLLVGELVGELLTNARKFGGPQVQVSITARQVERWLAIEVRDSGPGIPPELAADAFRMFRLLQPKGRYPGVGMGLAMARTIAEAHAGAVWIEPRAGTGTVVHLRLPAGPASGGTG